MAIRNVTRAGVGLVLGIIILAVLVYAGLWFVRERGEQARREEAISIADQQLQAESDGEVAIDVDDEAETQAPTAPESEQSTTIPQTGTSTEQSSSAAELPQTGPAEQFMSIIVLALVAFSVTTYVVSKKRLQNN